MQIEFIKVSEKGKVELPKNIRRGLHIKKGDRLVLVRDKENLLLKKASRKKENFDDLLVHAEETLKKIWDNPEDEIWSVYLK
tara:strand:- start:1717 stop:1962 length:246 start_codon:yes stop_codon:yes gene_type:complete